MIKKPFHRQKRVEGHRFSKRYERPFQPLGAVFKGDFLLIKDTIRYKKSQ